MLIILSIIILIFSVIFHEVSHGYMADLLGDPTARLQGRLTLNPLKHIDPIGSIIVPFITYITAGFAFGWAKPVVYNPYNLKNKRQGEFLIAVAGPASAPDPVGAASGAAGAASSEAGLTADLMSISHPVSRAARRTF